MFCVFCEILLPEQAKCCLQCGRRPVARITAPKYGRQSNSLTVEIGTPLEEIEKLFILRTLQLVNHDKKKAARLLGLSLKTLYNKLDRYKPQLRDRIDYRRIEDAHEEKIP